MIANVTIAGTEMEVEYDFNITLIGYGGAAPSLSYPGDPPEPCEFEIEVLGISFVKQAADYPTCEIPTWLNELIAQHLSERDDINEIVQTADQERDLYEY